MLVRTSALYSQLLMKMIQNYLCIFEFRQTIYYATSSNIFRKNSVFAEIHKDFVLLCDFHKLLARKTPKINSFNNFGKKKIFLVFHKTFPNSSNDFNEKRV